MGDIRAMKTITCFEIVDHGIDHAQYFQGYGVSRTKFTVSATGYGDNPAEALNDALESLAQADWDVSKVETSAEGVAYAKAVKPSTSDEVRAQLEADNPQGNGESDADYSARIDEYQSVCGSELYYYVSVRVTDQTDWDETPDGFVAILGGRLSR